MTRHLTPEEVRQLRDFILAAWRESPWLSERALYQRFLETHPDFVPVTLGRFRYHLHALKEEARREGDRDDSGPTALPPADLGREADLVHRLEALRLGLERDRQRERELEAALARLRSEMAARRGALRDLARALLGGVLTVELPPAHAWPADAVAQELRALAGRITAELGDRVPHRTALRVAGLLREGEARILALLTGAPGGPTGPSEEGRPAADREENAKTDQKP